MGHGVEDDDVALRIHHQVKRLDELAVALAFLAPGQQRLAFAAELDHTTVIGIGHVNVARRVHGHAAGHLELRFAAPATPDLPEQVQFEDGELAGRADGRRRRCWRRLRRDLRLHGNPLRRGHGRRYHQFRQLQPLRYLLQREEVLAGDDLLAAARRRPPELHVPAAAHLEVAHLDVVEALGELDAALAVFGTVLAAVVHHQLPVHGDERAIVGAGAETVGPGAGGGDLALPEDAERRAQRVVGQDEEITLDERRRAAPTGVGVVVTHQTVGGARQRVERSCSHRPQIEIGA